MLHTSYHKCLLHLFIISLTVLTKSENRYNERRLCRIYNNKKKGLIQKTGEVMFSCQEPYSP